VPVGSVLQAAAKTQTFSARYSKDPIPREPGSACFGPGPSTKPKSRQPERKVREY